MFDNISPYIAIPGAIASAIGIIAGVVKLYLNAKHGIDIQIKRSELVYPKLCMEAFDAFSEGCIKKHLPDTPVSKCLNELLKSEVYVSIAIINMTPQSIEDCTIETGSSTRYSQLTQNNVVTLFDRDNSNIFHINKIRPSESVHLQLWQYGIGAIDSYNYTRIVKFYTKTLNKQRMQFSSDAKRKCLALGDRFFVITAAVILITLLLASHIDVKITSNETVGSPAGKVESPNPK